MEQILGVKNLVLVGLFTPNTFDKYFFIKNNIVTEEEILPISIFDPVGGYIELVTNKFNILIGLQQIIVTASKPENNDDGIDRILLLITKLGNVKNVSALGVNFHWFLSDNIISFEELSKKYFYNEKIELF